MKYNKLTEQEKKEIIITEYVGNKKSLSDLAKELDTYANKIRRDAKKFNISIRSKSEAQKNALKTGKHKHPTKGTSRTQDTKKKIGKKLIDAWSNIDKKDKEKRRLKAKRAWEARTDDEKENILKKANEAVRQSSREGSKLEKYILNKLIECGYRTEFHKEQVLANTKLQIDIFMPTIATAIEVDGPSHFLPVWGEDTLRKNQEYDKKKSGLILGKGLYLIRIKQTRDYSPTRAGLICDNLIKVIEQISSVDNNLKTKIIEIGDVDG